MRKDLHTNMADYKAKQLFFESNHFLSQPLQISLIQKDLCGKLNEDEEAKLRMRILELKVELKQQKHPKWCNQPLGKQLCLLHTWKNNKEKLQQRGIWGDDITRELEMQQEKKAHLKILDRAKESNFSFDNWFYPGDPSTVTIEEIQDSQPTLALENSRPTPALENSAPALVLTIEDETDAEDETDETELPPCPVHLMY